MHEVRWNVLTHLLAARAVALLIHGAPLEHKVLRGEIFLRRGIGARLYRLARVPASCKAASGCIQHITNGTKVKVKVAG